MKWQIYLPYFLQTSKNIFYIRRYFLLICFLCSLFAVYALFWKLNKHSGFKPPASLSSCNYFMPVVKFYGIAENEKTLDIVEHLFQRMGYQIHHHENMEWDILWSHTYPFYSLAKELANLKSNQKVNHFPGSGFITHKSNLASLAIDQLPKSFILPAQKEDFLDFAKENGGKSWIMKSESHRGMKLINDVENTKISGSFIQEFISNPLLISEKKFDIGVYVMLTSIDPLRVYIYSGDVLLRFCKQNYYPFNADFPESYIVGDDYLPIWEVEDLKFYYSELNFTSKESLNAYLQSKGETPEVLWSQISDTVQNVYINTEGDLKRNAMKLGNLRNFFELVRFDFIVDGDLDVFLLEVNMSPNLSAAHFPENQLLYEQILYNSFSLAGFIRNFPDTFVYRGEAEVSDKDLQVFADQCASQMCQTSCQNFKCIICNQCLNKETKQVAKSAYLEFMNRGKYRRILPAPIVQNENIGDNDVQLSPMNSFMRLWFKGKCLQDNVWCQ